jgi:hypothetical protein
LTFASLLASSKAFSTASGRSPPPDTLTVFKNLIISLPSLVHLD